MKIQFSLVILCLFLINCNRIGKQKVKWENNITQSKIDYKFDSTEYRVYRHYDLNFNAWTRFGSSVNINNNWKLRFEFVDVNGKAVLTLDKISTFGTYETEMFPYRFISDFGITTNHYPDGNYDYVIKLCYVCLEEEEIKKAIDDYLIDELGDTMGFVGKTISSEAQKSFLEYEKMNTSKIINTIIKSRIFDKKNLEDEWCKYINVVAHGNMFTFSESPRNSLPKQFDVFKNIEIKESGNYLDTLIFDQEDMMRRCIDYLSNSRLKK
jgi:hypothetical protein